MGSAESVVEAAANLAPGTTQIRSADQTPPDSNPPTQMEIIDLAAEPPPPPMNADEWRRSEESLIIFPSTLARELDTVAISE